MVRDCDHGYVESPNQKKKKKTPFHGNSKLIYVGAQVVKCNVK
jgi:hypothetical protein